LAARARLDRPPADGDAPGSPDESERGAGGALVRVVSTILVLVVIGVLLAYTLRRRR
jgi:hypothetical protein